MVTWRGRYLARGLEGLDDAPRPGRPRRVDHARVVAATLTPPPRSLGITHWSTRLLAPRLGVSPATVARAWRAYGIQPWRAQSFRFSTAPEFVGKVTDVCGLYLSTNEDVPASAIVLSVDEKSQIQALDRTVPVLPMQPGRIGRRSHDYHRHGTTTLFAALEVATGRVTAALRPRHRHQELLAFLRQVERAHHDAVDEQGRPVELHLIMDGYATHKHKDVRAWLEANPRFHVHFTPPTPPGRTSSRSGSPSWSARRYDARCPGRSRTSTTPSAPTSTPGTNVPTPSSGPGPPNRYSPKPTVQQLQARDTRAVLSASPARRRRMRS